MNSSLIFGYGILWLGVGATRETFVIPNRYQGDVYVVHATTFTSSQAKGPGRVEYEIPNEGVLAVHTPINQGLTRTKYFYKRSDGSLQEISELWPSTIPPTPDNLANDKDVGVYFPRSGSFSNTDGCQFEFEQFYVGTKAFLLKHYKPLDLDQYLQEHKLGCSNPEMKSAQ